MNKIGIHLIFGSNPEPFLGAALRSVSWADYFCCVNTAPEDGNGQANESTVRRWIPRDKLRVTRLNMSTNFDFSKARNAALALADNGDYVMILDSDDVHYPEWGSIAHHLVDAGHDIITAHFWHLIGYKDLWGQEPHREILFKKQSGVRFYSAVHEGLEHPRTNPALAGDYHYVHYGYIKPPREIFKRWKLYSEIEGDPDHYVGRNPDDALDGWLDNTQPFWRDHPPVVRELLESYPTAPKSVRAIEAPCNIGLVLMTWNDKENLRICLRSLATTRQSFELCVVDNGSTDGTLDVLAELSPELDAGSCRQRWVISYPDSSLAQALNKGFELFLNRSDIDYIGWIHPDMVFERDTWLECLRHCLDIHSDIVKVGASEINGSRSNEPIAGNSQCYLVRKSALRQVGLFDERFIACGGYEDWDHNNKLLTQGRVMIWPDALIRHNSMGTRSKHDNKDAARYNADIYHGIWGSWSPQI